MATTRSKGLAFPLDPSNPGGRYGLARERIVHADKLRKMKPMISTAESQSWRRFNNIKRHIPNKHIVAFQDNIRNSKAASDPKNARSFSAKTALGNAASPTLIRGSSKSPKRPGTAPPEWDVSSSPEPRERPHSTSQTDSERKRGSRRGVDSEGKHSLSPEEKKERKQRRLRKKVADVLKSSQPRYLKFRKWLQDEDLKMCENMTRLLSRLPSKVAIKLLEGIIEDATDQRFLKELQPSQGDDKGGKSEKKSKGLEEVPEEEENEFSPDEEMKRPDDYDSDFDDYLEDITAQCTDIKVTESNIEMRAG